MSDKEIMKESELYLNCETCGEKINLGEDFRYETKGYRAFCRDFDCIDGWETHGANLETCWWGSEDEDLIIKWGE